MNRLEAFLEQDRTLPNRIANEPNRTARLDVITESIRLGEAALKESSDWTAAANAMLAVASSHVMAAIEVDTPDEKEYHARRGATWAARAVRAAGDAPGAILHFVPRAATLVSAGLAYVPEDTRRNWLDSIDTWVRQTTNALETQPAATTEGTRDLIVGLALLEGTDIATTAEVPRLRAEAASLLGHADELLTAAGEPELAAEARNALATGE